MRKAASMASFLLDRVNVRMDISDHAVRIVSQNGCFSCLSSYCYLVTSGVQCASPPSIDDGSFSGVMSVYVFGHVVTYSCNEDYELVGDATRTCSGSTSGIWTGSTPRCACV